MDLRDEWRINDCNLSLHRWNKGYCYVVNNRDFPKGLLKLPLAVILQCSHEMVKIILISLIHCTHTHMFCPLPFTLHFRKKSDLGLCMFSKLKCGSKHSRLIMLMGKCKPHVSLQAHCSFLYRKQHICSITRNSGKEERLTCWQTCQVACGTKKEGKTPEQNSLFFLPV